MNNRVLALCCIALALSGCSYLPSWMGGMKEDKPKLPGQRVAVLPAGTDIAPDDLLKNVSVTVPAAKENANWPQHTGVLTSQDGNLSAKGSFESQESASAGDGESFSHTLIPRPVVGSGLVFAMDAVGNISAHDAQAVSSVRWKSKGVAEEDEPEIMGGGLAWDNGRLYVTSGRGMVAAFDAVTGVELWKKNLHLPFRSAPKVAGNKLYAVTVDNQIYAISTASGEALWNQRGIGETAGILNSVSPAVSGDTVIVPYSSGEIYALSSIDGKEIWSEALSSGKRTEASAFFSGIGGDPVLDEGVVMAVSSGGMMSVFATSTGQRVWDKPLGSINTPWVAGDYAFLLTTDNTLVALVKYSGRICWTAKLASFEDEEEKKRPITWFGPVMVNGQLAVVSSSGELTLISAADGKTATTKSIPDGIYTAPVIAGGRMYLIGQNATLYSLQ